MNTIKSLKIVAISMLVSSTVWASSDDNKENTSEMNMMNDTNGGMMMSQKSKDMQFMHEMMRQMNTMGNNHDHGHNHGHGYGHGQHPSMMGGSMGGMMMNPQMMQMRMKHMTNMEQRLKNIESLLSQLVELQKSSIDGFQ